MPRDEKGRFTKEENGFSLTLPSPFSILKYLFICLVLYPWYKILGLIINYCFDKLQIKVLMNKMVCKSQCPACPACPPCQEFK